MADDIQEEIRFLGIESSSAFVREPDGNGCTERLIRTVKEMWVRTFNTIEELRQALLEFKELYNNFWIIERHGNKSPARFLKEQLDSMRMAA